MSKRNFILLIILLVAALVGVLVYFYLRGNPSTPGEEGSGTNFISQFNPFSSNPPKIPPKTNNPTDISGNVTIPPAQTLGKLVKISSMPVAGYGLFSKERLKELPPPVLNPDGTVATPTPAQNQKPAPPPTEFALAVRYTDRATGNIYETFADQIEEFKYTTTVIPKIYEALFGNQAQSIVMRYLKGDGKTIQTFAGSIPKEIFGGDTTVQNEVKGAFLPESIADMSISPDKASVFYLFNMGDGIIGTTMNLITGKKTQVFDSPFTEWLSQWPKSSTVTLTTKPSSGIPGYMYSLDLATKKLTRTLGGIAGLTTLESPDGKLVLYADGNLSLNLFRTSSQSGTSLGLRTLPEKCVWGSASDTIYCGVPKIAPSGGYPDSWYQGVVSFSDQIWKVDAVTGNAAIVFDPGTSSSGEEIDATKLSLDAHENYLFSVNKKDSFLWELALSATPAPTSEGSSSTSSGAPIAPGVYPITIQNFAFSPATLTIKKGDTVVWTNKDGSPHTVTGDSGGPSSKSLNTNATYSYTFADSGTFNYHCSIHPSMLGVVIVQ